MEYVYSAMLLHSAKQPVTEENVKRVLSATGAQADELKVKQLVTALEGVDIDEAVKQAAVVAAAPSAAAGGAEAKKEEKKDEKSEAAKEEEAAAGLAALFG